MLNNSKPFFWNKLSNAQLGSTVWSELDSPERFVLDMKELEYTFTVDNSTQSGASQTASAISLNKKQAVTTLLDITRANNVGECSSDHASDSNSLRNSYHVG
jgi:diaphanous 1